MSSDTEADEVCANCGKSAVDDIKLKICTACKLVKYCSVECQKNHRPKHKKTCKKRAAEIRYDLLFTQPDESHYGECPICCLPLPLDGRKSTVNSCCSKTICIGCAHANKIHEDEQGLEHKCPYCREQLPKTDEKIKQNYMERAKANDPVALNELGKHANYQGDYEAALEYLTKAAALGDADAHYELACMYFKGGGVEKDEKKKVYHSEEAAIGGHAGARYMLGVHEGVNGRIDRANKHFIIAANLGHGKALEGVKTGYRIGDVRKEDLESALRGHQTAVDAAKSEQREEAYAFYKDNQIGAYKYYQTQNRQRNQN
jgi:tetratricopeptide (TPR) repeat protein